MGGRRGTRPVPLAVRDRWHLEGSVVIEEGPAQGTESVDVGPEERLRIAKLAAGLGIHEYRPQTGEILWDQRVRELWGVGPDEPVMYELFMSGLHPDDRAPTQAVVDVALDPAGDGVYHAQYRVISRADGRTRWLDATGQVAFEDGRAVRLIGTVMDITALKETEARLRDALGAKDEFLGFISHELRTPMTVILGMSRLLAARTLPEQQRQELVADIYTSAQELDAMIESLLVLARFGPSLGEPHLGQLEEEPVLLPRLVADVLERRRAEDAAHRYRLDIRCPDAIAACDLSWTERVLANLLGNAAKYSPAGGSITAVVDASDGEVRVSVLDEGCGIAADEVEQLFEPFYRSPSTKDVVPGAGLGLTVCKRIVEGMGGRVWAWPRPSGGAEFGFALPSAWDDGAAGGHDDPG